MWNTPEGVRQLKKPYSDFWAFGAAFVAELYHSYIYDCGDEEGYDFVFEMLSDLTPTTLVTRLLRLSQHLLTPIEPPSSVSIYDDVLIGEVVHRYLTAIDPALGKARDAVMLRVFKRVARIYRDENGRQEFNVNVVEDVEFVLDTVTEELLFDRDYELLGMLDASPEVRKTLGEQLGLAHDFYDLPPSVPPNLDEAYLQLLTFLAEHSTEVEKAYRGVRRKLSAKLQRKI